MEWLRQISKAIDYIENNLTGEISYDEAAKIACCSTYYFQRMFSYISGVTLSDYIRRRRMTQAAFDIQSSETKIIDIGTKYGYASPTSFNRAFQSVHGISPTAARAEGTLLQSYPPISFKIAVTGGESMRYRIEKKEAFRVVGARTTLQEDMEENQKSVPKFWNKMLGSTMLSEICKLANPSKNNIFGITAYTNPENIYYYIATETDRPVPDGMYELEIPQATWVIFECNGYFKESVQTIFKRFIMEWLPFSGYKYAELPDIEVYPINDQQSKSGYAEVWIAVKKEKEEEWE